MQFQKWVKERGGVPKVAKELNISSRAVNYWVAKSASPRRDSLKKLLKLSKGELTIQSIIEDTSNFYASN